jgi:hypothetical protein
VNISNKQPRTADKAWSPNLGLGEKGLTVKNSLLQNVPCYMGPLSPRHGTSSGCGWREGLLTRRVAANIFNKQLQTADKGWSSILGVGRGARTPHLKSVTCYEMFESASELD